MGADRLLRDRLFGWRIGLHLVVAWGVLLALPPRLAHADAVAPPPFAAPAAAGSDPIAGAGPVGSAGERIGDDPVPFRLAREERLLRARLLDLGVSAADADVVIGRLTPPERAELASRAPELAAGGSAVAPILAVAIIVGLLFILILELIGRRVVSRPTT
jgi:hypothetical protein